MQTALAKKNEWTRATTVRTTPKGRNLELPIPRTVRQTPTSATVWCSGTSNRRSSEFPTHRRKSNGKYSQTTLKIAGGRNPNLSVASREKALKAPIRTLSTPHESIPVEKKSRKPRELDRTTYHPGPHTLRRAQENKHSMRLQSMWEKRLWPSKMWTFELHEHANMVHGLKDLLLSQNRAHWHETCTPWQSKSLWKRNLSKMRYSLKTSAFTKKTTTSRRRTYTRPCRIIMPQL